MNTPKASKLAHGSRNKIAIQFLWKPFGSLTDKFANSQPSVEVKRAHIVIVVFGDSEPTPAQHKRVVVVTQKNL